MEENKDYVPGYDVRPHGYIVFATTLYGEVFCFDTHAMTHPTTAPVVLIVHDLEPENDEMKREDLTKLAKPIANSFEHFLQSFASETLDIKPLYRPFNPGNSEEPTPS